MYIKKLSIKNFRNLQDVTIDFTSSEQNMYYFTGENGIGKSNIIELIHLLFTENHQLFSNLDFNVSTLTNENIDVSIQVYIEIQLVDRECGLFEDYQDESNVLKLLYIQYLKKPENATSNYGWVYNRPTTDNLIPDFNFFKNKLTIFPCYRYSPKSHLDKENFFQSNGRIHSFFRFIIEKQLQQCHEPENPDTECPEKIDIIDILNNQNIPNFAQNIHDFFESTFNTPNPSLKLNYDNVNIVDLLADIATLTHSETSLHLTQLGRGRSYYLYPFVEFTSYIYDLLSKESCHFIEDITIEENQQKYLTPIILFDEPEVFLSPFLQRQFMDQWAQMFQNSENNNSIIHKLISLYNEESSTLYNLSPLFFISTHSPNIIPHLDMHITENQLAIYRLYDNSNNDIQLGQLNTELTTLKQFLLYNRQILEGLFSKKVIIVEGATEMGFIPYTLQKNSINIYEKNILIISAPPTEFPNIAEIFNSYGIKTYILTDSDGTTGQPCPRATDLKAMENKPSINIYISDRWDFEDSILYNVQQNNNSIYQGFPQYRGATQPNTIYSHSDDDVFKLKLQFMRDNRKTITDSYQLANQFSTSTIPLPDYIQQLIQDLNDD